MIRKVKSLYGLISIFISVLILIFNGTIGYFVLTAKYGTANGTYVFLALSILAILTAFTPILMKGSNFLFYFRVLLYVNVVVAFYPLIYKVIASYLISRLI
ncbi:hypothetical protein PY093_09915 [Cytobacillus sp. S13-E01]|uniref:hypothetical protein n=1 Tax=Cytobacillus sp. S13-E01 TaxID=3031326 RepID=UPI0023D7E1B3|nr:hypothetical protein [Cytobacillus sp. S13-E01]MDF0727032.1 hypothetical protein [Cytobacillus sp. S13-E01]